MFSDILIDFNQRPAYVIDKSLDLCLNILNAAMAELADAPDLGSGAARRAGSTPVTRTKPI